MKYAISAALIVSAAVGSLMQSSPAPIEVHPHTMNSHYVPADMQDGVQFLRFDVQDDQDNLLWDVRGGGHGGHGGGHTGSHSGSHTTKSRKA